MSSERVIALIDMDCFYVQCEQRLVPTLWSHPCAVAQYNSWKGGGLIAVNYEARGYGVKRGVRGNDAIALCPDIHIFSVPEVRGKADLSRYREASEEVFEAIKQLVTNLDEDIIVEKASIDEAFIDLTKYIDKLFDRSEPLPQIDEFVDTKIETNDTTDFDVWHNRITMDPLMLANDVRLLFGALIVQRIRKEILDKTQFKCSAGISHNKMLAKLACGLNKPNAQTILPKSGVDKFFRRTDINKVRCLGGKLGTNVKNLLKITNMYELKCLDYKELAKHFDAKTAKWLKEVASGHDDEPVANRQLSKSLGCGKNFPGKTALATPNDVNYWVKQLSEELVERITRDKEVNKRSPKLLTIGWKFHEKDNNSRSLPLDSNCNCDQLANQIMREVFNKIKLEPIVNLSIAASKFIEDCDDPSTGTVKLDNYFTRIDKPQEISASDGPSSSGLGPVPIKSMHTKTLEEFWKPSTSRDQAYNGSLESSKLVDELKNKSYNPWNTSPFVMKRASEKLITKLNPTTESGDQNSDKTSDDGIEIVNQIDAFYDIESLDLMQDEPEIKPPVKRGFFYRKLMQFREEEKIERQKRLKERMDTKNIDVNGKKRKESEEIPVLDISSD